MEGIKLGLVVILDFITIIWCFIRVEETEYKEK